MKSLAEIMLQIANEEYYQTHCDLWSPEKCALCGNPKLPETEVCDNCQLESDREWSGRSTDYDNALEQQRNR